jgi:hypothetical protein
LFYLNFIAQNYHVYLIKITKMKKFLLTIGALASISLSSIGQTRMTLHEEFTGENCPPCASTNPAFWALCDAGSNPSKLLHISYMVPIPSAGFYCNRTTAIFTNRDAYYSVPFAPYGRFDGHVPNATTTSPGHPGYFTQADIDSEAAVASPFTMTMTSAWDPTFSNITTTINVTCVTAYSGTLYLRTALIQTNDFAVSPGTNGETHFANVVQAMYPDAVGTSIAGTWTAGMTSSYTITGACPSWVDKSIAPYMVAWIQNDADKRIAQAARSASLPLVTNDAAITSVTGPTGMICVANGPYTLAHSVTLSNSGTATLTSATIFYSIDGGAFVANPWTGSIAPGASATVIMPPATVTVTGALAHTAYDSVGLPNGSVDRNLINNTGGKYIFIESTNALPLPYSTSFETADLGKFDDIDANSNGETWATFNNGTGPALGHTGSNAALFNCYNFAAGESEVMTIPEVATGAPALLTFYTAHCVYTVATPENDMLEVVYSTNCGSSWTSIWSKSGTALANQPAATARFIPTASQYTIQTTALNAVPAGAIIGLRGTSAFGNNIWVDDINIVSTAGVGVMGSTPELSLYPNPASDAATLSLNLNSKMEVQISIADQLGRVLTNVTNEKMDAGMHSVVINTASLANGVYNIMVHTENGTYTQRLSVAK